MALGTNGAFLGAGETGCFNLSDHFLELAGKILRDRNGEVDVLEIQLIALQIAFEPVNMADIHYIGPVALHDEFIFFQQFFRVGHAAPDHLASDRFPFFPEYLDVIIGRSDKKERIDPDRQAVLLVIGYEVDDLFLP
jgi:hypothetical protein